MAETAHYSCWCQAKQETVNLIGEIVGRRAAEILLIQECREQACPNRGAPDCLIGKEIESRWP